MMIKSKSSQGFTLPELLLTAAILGYALSIMLMLFINTTALNQASRNLTTATIHAEYIMENLKNTAFAQIATNINNGTWNWNTAAITSNGLTALNTENITTTYSGTNPLTVTVAVTWADNGGRSRSKSLSTLISG